MKALSFLKTAVNQNSLVSLAALILLVPLLYPAAGAQASGQSAVVFQINSDPQNQNSISFQQNAQKDPLVVNLQNYLQGYDSPLADYVPQLVSKDNWKQVIAISFVESNMCVHDYYYNCSGIGGQDYLRKYHDFGEWIDDMSNLLDQRYQDWTFDQMNGVYVQPKSKNWAYGAKKIKAELDQLQRIANYQRTTMYQTALNQNIKTLALN
ncbi:MAG: hypothetical protein KGJ93_05325 [Patescibacteria group bacterium]|nr:hypothetical protein [Patescibacteria group bacterium]